MVITLSTQTADGTKITPEKPTVYITTQVTVPLQFCKQQVNTVVGVNNLINSNRNLCLIFEHQAQLSFVL